MCDGSLIVDPFQTHLTVGDVARTSKLSSHVPHPNVWYLLSSFICSHNGFIRFSVCYLCFLVMSSLLLLGHCLILLWLILVCYSWFSEDGLVSLWVGQQNSCLSYLLMDNNVPRAPLIWPKTMYILFIF